MFCLLGGMIGISALTGLHRLGKSVRAAERERDSPRSNASKARHGLAYRTEAQTNTFPSFFKVEEKTAAEHRDLYSTKEKTTESHRAQPIALQLTSSPLAVRWQTAPAPSSPQHRQMRPVKNHRRPPPSGSRPHPRRWELDRLAFCCRPVRSSPRPREAAPSASFGGDRQGRAPGRCHHHRRPPQNPQLGRRRLPRCHLEKKKVPSREKSSSEAGPPIDSFAAVKVTLVEKTPVKAIQHNSDASTSRPCTEHLC